MSTLGVYSEVGKLRKVMVHRPDLSLKRLTPSNCEELLFDGVLWVKKARWEHDAFVDQMRSRGIEVVIVHDLLTETMKDPEARNWLLDRKVTPNEQGLKGRSPKVSVPLGCGSVATGACRKRACNTSR